MAHLSLHAGGSTSTWSRLSFTHHKVSPAFTDTHYNTIMVGFDLQPYPLYPLFLNEMTPCRCQKSHILLSFSFPNSETVQGHLEVVIKCLTSLFESDFNWDYFMFSNSNVKLTLLKALNNDGLRRTALCLWSQEWVFRISPSPATAFV